MTLLPIRVLPTVLSGAAFQAALCFFAVLAPAQIVLNEVMTDTARTLADEEGQAGDWVELLNTSAEAVDLSNWALSDEEKDSSKWIIPRGAIGPGERLVVWCTGKDRAMPPQEAIEKPGSGVRFVATLVSRDAQWRYFAGGPGDTDPPGEWAAPTFDDSAWLMGQGGFGFGWEGARTILSAGTSAFFLRHEFHADPGSLDALVLRVRFDDGFICFLNGTPVAAANMRLDAPLGFGTRSTRATNPDVDVLFDLSGSPSRLQPGRNVIAIAAFNVSPSSEDLALVAELGSVAPIFHTSFALSRNGETVFLVRPDGAFEDKISIPSLGRDRSFGRFPDGSGRFAHLSTPSPGLANEGPAFDTPVPIDFAATPEAGWHPGPVAVRLEARIDIPIEIRYTLDGARPTSVSPQLLGPITFDRTSVLRAAGFLGGREVIFGRSRTYIPGLWRYSLPVISVALSPGDLRQLKLPDAPGGMAGEREAWLEVIDGRGAVSFSEGAGLRRHGNSLRATADKPSFRLHFRDVYGAGRLRYPLLAGIHEYNAVVLRGQRITQNGASAALFEDQLARLLSEELGNIGVRGGWYHLFLNGIHEGLYNVVERLDEALLEQWSGATGWTIVKGGEVVAGRQEEWDSVVGLSRGEGNLPRSSIDELLRRVDADDFARYVIVHTWLGNGDFPVNWYAVKSADEESKWKFVTWDGDGIGALTPQRSVEYLWTNAPILNFRGLFQDAGFQEALLTTFQQAVRGTLSSANVVDVIKNLRATLEADIPLEVETNGGSLQDWRSAVDRLIEFARSREAAVYAAVVRSSLLSIPVVLAADPPRLARRYGVKVKLHGVRLAPVTRVRFDGIEALGLRVVSAEELEVVIPDPTELNAWPAIRVEDSSGGGLASVGLLELLPDGHGFVRGDADGDGRLSVSDAVRAVLALVGSVDLDTRCPQAADADASGRLDVSDPITLLRFLFLNGSPPPAPFPGCGPGPDDFGSSCGRECRA